MKQIIIFFRIERETIAELNKYWTEGGHENHHPESQMPFENKVKDWRVKVPSLFWSLTDWKEKGRLTDA